MPNGWRPRRYQRGLIYYLQKGGLRADVAAHRRWGKDEVALHWTATQLAERVGLYWHMLPEAGQGRKAICAGSPTTISAAAPPLIDMPASATSPCALYTLPDSPTEADLDIGYATRGANLLACDAARRLAVQTWQAEHDLQDRRVSRKRGWFGQGAN